MKDICELIVSGQFGPQIISIIHFALWYCHQHLMQCYRMKTNTEEGGVERITVSALRPGIDAKPRHRIHLTDLATKDRQLDPQLLAPHSVLIMLAFYTVLAAVYEKSELMEACGVEVFCKSRFTSQDSPVFSEFLMLGFRSWGINRHLAKLKAWGLTISF